MATPALRCWDFARQECYESSGISGIWNHDSNSNSRFRIPLIPLGLHRPGSKKRQITPCCLSAFQHFLCSVRVPQSLCGLPISRECPIGRSALPQWWRAHDLRRDNWGGVIVQIPHTVYIGSQVYLLCARRGQLSKIGASGFMHALVQRDLLASS